MRLITFASGSGGNCALVSGGDTHILIDAGISMRRIGRALGNLGLGYDDIDGILVTHEHSDHIGGLPMIVKYHPIPVYAPPVVGRRLTYAIPEIGECLRSVPTEQSFDLGEISVLAFHTSHDMDESVGYRLESGESCLGFCTDTGCVTPEMERHLARCGAVLLEANHDEMMLRYGPYPVSLKRRILSEHGHMSNELCAAFACELAHAGTRSFALGHLSKENNTPAAALAAVRASLDAAGFARLPVLVAPADGEMEMEVPACCESD